MNILFYWFYSLFVICFLQASWFCWWILTGERVRDWHSNVIFLRNHTPTFFMDLLQPVRQHNKTRGQLVIFSTYKQNYTEWATICCSRHISKILVNFYFCCALVDWVISYIEFTSDLAFLKVCVWNLLFIYTDLLILIYWFILYILIYLLLLLSNYFYCY